MSIELHDYQWKAVNELRNGSILCGGVGSGKSITALAYYMFRDCLGNVKVTNWDLPFFFEKFEEMKEPRDLYIITTAKKRDSLEWEKECVKFGLARERENSISNVKVVVDSWNNIKKYQKIYGAFFIFDEQRVIGSGAWVKAFLNISRKNHWILLSATPGDQWSDYIPVFIANDFYKNKTEFNSRHCVFSRFSKYPKIERYVGEKELVRQRDSILVHMEDDRLTERVKITKKVSYNKDLYRRVFRDHWNPFENCPIEESGKWVYLLRRVVNSDPSRIEEIDKIIKDKERCIIFYNFTYELELLRNYLDSIDYVYNEWNGKKHEVCPDGKKWVYLVQYTAGCEGWNCITTDTIIFYSQNYSYRMTEQASGRIDRINTPYEKLYYYYLRSSASIDFAIYLSLKNKKNFNESSFVRRR